MDRGTTAVTGTATLDAADPFAETESTPFRRVHAADRENVVGVGDGADAMFADSAHKALRQNTVERGNEVVGFNAHVQEPAQHIDHVVGVYGGENQVARQRG